MDAELREPEEVVGTAKVLIFVSHAMPSTYL